VGQVTCSLVGWLSFEVTFSIQRRRQLDELHKEGLRHLPVAYSVMNKVGPLLQNGLVLMLPIMIQWPAAIFCYVCTVSHIHIQI